MSKNPKKKEDATIKREKWIYGGKIKNKISDKINQIITKSNNKEWFLLPEPR